MKIWIARDKDEDSSLCLYGKKPKLSEEVEGLWVCSQYDILVDVIVYTLEKFEEKFPYKVEDKVLYKPDNKTYFIIKMFLENDKILYELSDEVCLEECNKPYILISDVDVVKLQPYKEENMEERKYSDLRLPLDDDDKLATEVTIGGNKIFPPNGYLIGKITKVDNGMLVEFVKKQPQ